MTPFLLFRVPKEKRMRSAKPVVVIGAGLGGLASAISLGAAGFEVTVLEAGPRAGGKAGIATVDGVRFDTGPSLLTMPRVLDDVFVVAGERREDHVTLRTLDHSFRYHYADGATLDIFHDVARSLDAVRESFGAEASQELEAFLAYSARIWEASADAFVFGAAPSVRRVLGLDVKTVFGLTRIDAMRSMWSAITRRVRNPHLRMMLARYATYNGSDVRQAPATLNCIAHVELGMGGYGVQGGIFSLVEALVALAERNGVRFLYNSPVQEIVTKAGHVVGVSTAEEHIATEHVVANADAAHVLGSLLPKRERIETGLAPSMSGWTAVLRASRSVDRVPHEVWFPEHYLSEFEQIFDGGRVCDEPTVYVCSQELTHGINGWADEEPLFVMVNAPATAKAEADDAPTDQLEGHVRRVLRQRGVVDASAELVWQRTPRALETRFPGSRGAIYGWASNDRFAAFRRPANRQNRPKGLYLASGSAHPGGGMPLCLLSGLRAAEAVRADVLDTSRRAG
jgi:phytoene desaturase